MQRVTVASIFQLVSAGLGALYGLFMLHIPPVFLRRPILSII
jgi:hypothetical protein